MIVFRDRGPRYLISNRNEIEKEKLKLFGILTFLPIKTRICLKRFLKIIFNINMFKKRNKNFSFKPNNLIKPSL